jgi:hypothetical protein
LCISCQSVYATLRMPVLNDWVKHAVIPKSDGFLVPAGER